MIIINLAVAPLNSQSDFSVNLDRAFLIELDDQPGQERR